MNDDQAVYAFLDIFFTVFHSGFVLFNLTGWGWHKTRTMHLITIGLTILSWFGLGVIYGWGYCPFTDWHWTVKEKLGQTGLPLSYIKYYADKLTGLNWDAGLIDMLVVCTGLSLLILSIWVNFRARYRSRN
jgi:hypothetical protein